MGSQLVIRNKPHVFFVSLPAKLGRDSLLTAAAHRRLAAFLFSLLIGLRFLSAHISSESYFEYVLYGSRKLQALLTERPSQENQFQGIRDKLQKVRHAEKIRPKMSMIS